MIKLIYLVRGVLIIVILCCLGRIESFSTSTISSARTSNSVPVSAVTAIRKMSCEDCQKLFLKREKKLGFVRSLLNASGVNLASPLTAQQEERLHSRKKEQQVNHELESLKKVYRRQYSFFNRQRLPAQGGQYQSIMKEMKGLLDQLDQKELSYLVKYQKAQHCHELFASLERMLMKDGSLTDMSMGSLGDGESYHSEVMTTMSGSVEQSPRKKIRKPRPEEAEDMPFMVVPASIGTRHGLDKLLDVDERR